MSRYCNDFLCHYGVIGMKWGIRKYQNPDGTLTPEGYKRYGKNADKLNAEAIKDSIKNSTNYENRRAVNKRMSDELASSKEAKTYHDTVYNKTKGWILNDDNGAYGAYYLPGNTSKKIVQEVQNAADDYDAKYFDLGKKYYPEWRGAVLKDIGYEDTEAGRQYLLKLGIE